MSAPFLVLVVVAVGLGGVSSCEWFRDVECTKQRRIVTEADDCLTSGRCSFTPRALADARYAVTFVTDRCPVNT